MVSNSVHLASPVVSLTSRFGTLFSDASRKSKASTCDSLLTTNDFTVQMCDATESLMHALQFGYKKYSHFSLLKKLRLFRRCDFYICFMSAEKILGEWQKKNFKPVYWLEGEEPYYIDMLVNYAEHQILNESEAGFNLTVFYGRDADWTAIVNACRRYPMFAERQVVVLKEAQHMKDIEKLVPYIENPLPSTVFVVGYKEKKLDGRGSFSKLVKKGGYLLSEKIKDYQLNEWTSNMIQQMGLSINQKALLVLADHIGNDLSRLQNEIDKLAV